MVNKLLRFFLYFIFFILALIYFTPKNSIYYFLEKELKPYGVIISDEEVTDRAFFLEILHSNISFEKIQSVSISTTDIKIFALYNSINFKDIVLSSVAESFIPLHVENVNIIYTILSPLHILGSSYGEFGEVHMSVSILERKLHVTLIPSELMLKKYQSTLGNFVKNQNGEYEYDKVF